MHLRVEQFSNHFTRSTILNDLINATENFNLQTVYYYCDYTDLRTLEPLQIFGNFMKQLFMKGLLSESQENQIAQRYSSTGGDILQPDEIELADLTESAFLSCTAGLRIVLDGIDECSIIVQQLLTRFLKRLSTSAKSKLHIMVTCREEDQLLRTLNTYQRVQISSDTTFSDMESFIYASVRAELEKGTLKVQNRALEQEIVSELVAKAQGMLETLTSSIGDAR